MILRIMRSTIWALVLLLHTSFDTRAQTAAATQEAQSIRANTGVVGVISGGVDGTYIRIASDLASVLDDRERLRVLPIIGKGSLQNISDIMLLKGIDVGIVQSDAMAYSRRQQLFPRLDQSVQYIAKLYDEEVHILARKDITRLDDLAGQKVNVDVSGSGTSMTTSVVFDALGIAAQLTNDDQRTALEKLKRGEIAALTYVAGKPTKLFDGIGGDTGLHFLPVELTKPLQDTYVPAQLSHADYGSLIADGATVETIAVGSVMAVFAWTPGHERYNHVARFVDAFFSKFQLFLQPQRHPKWKDVNLAAQVPGWTRFPAATAWLSRQADGGGGADGRLQTDFVEFMSRQGGRLTNVHKEALFRQFLDWQRERGLSRITQ